MIIFQFRNIILSTLLTFSLFNLPTAEEKALPSGFTATEIEECIKSKYVARNSAFVKGDLAALSAEYDMSQNQGIWSCQNEVRRSKYLSDWSCARDMCFTDIHSDLRVKKITDNGNKIKVSFDETLNFQYVYNSDAAPVYNNFAVGLRHTIQLVKKASGLKIYSDWYTDCFQDALKSYSGEIITSPRTVTKFQLGNCTKAMPEAKKGRYNRIKAVEYADKYCGNANGNGNNFKYNKKYRDYTGMGGDCTNFASQVIGDKEGGGLRQDSTWRSVNREGSHAWVNTDGLRDYLVYSGKAYLIRKGSFAQLAVPSIKNPCGSVGLVTIGDLICYAKGSNIDHFGIFTAWDSHGYPLVNSHTTDRYHVPWDLGWSDSEITFHLLHVN